MSKTYLVLMQRLLRQRVNLVTFQGTLVIRITTVVGSHLAEWTGPVRMPRLLRNRPMGRSIHAWPVVLDMTSPPAGNVLVGLHEYKCTGV